ncbi:MAG TPA: GNAT family N-acetyltransferase [Bacteroidia bacterium]
MTIIAETERLLLREMTEHDAENAYNLNIDPEVLKFTGDEPFDSVDAAKEFLKAYKHYEQYGFGRWAVILKSTGEYLGWCGLKYTPELDEFDLGYRLSKKHWGQGYATEASIVALKLGFNQFNMKQIVGRVMQGNTASSNVLKKVGMTFLENREDDGEIEEIYRLAKNTFEAL